MSVRVPNAGELLEEAQRQWMDAYQLADWSFIKEVDGVILKRRDSKNISVRAELVIPATKEQVMKAIERFEERPLWDNICALVKVLDRETLVDGSEVVYLYHQNKGSWPISARDAYFVRGWRSVAAGSEGQGLLGVSAELKDAPLHEGIVRMSYSNNGAIIEPILKEDGSIDESQVRYTFIAEYSLNGNDPSSIISAIINTKMPATMIALRDFICSSSSY